MGAKLPFRLIQSQPCSLVLRLIRAIPTPGRMFVSKELIPEGALTPYRAKIRNV